MFDVKYPEDDEEIHEDHYSWKIHRLRKHVPTGKEVGYGDYLPSESEDATVGSVDSDEVGELLEATDPKKEERQQRDL